MLRMVILSLFSFGCFSVSATYVEPSQELIERQKQHMVSSIKDVDEVMKDKAFQKQLLKDKTQIDTTTYSKGNLIDLSELSHSTAGNNSLWDSKNNEKGLLPSESFSNPIILISFSMPDIEIELIMKEAKLLNAGVFIQGFVDDEFSKTYEKIAGLVEKTGVGIGIDPTLFERFNIKIVPSFVLPLESVQQCTKSECNTPSYVKAAGSSLRYFLEFLIRNGDENERTVAAKWIGKE